ncbi:MAG: hypothetical protein JW843_00790 [Candidatus Aminicenantes bacterium]|nr:hypothetical protein [Candidatus Aminicenantes bacterium]
MRKTWILILAVVLVVGVTACGKKGEEAAKEGVEKAEAAVDQYAALGKYAEVGPVMDKFVVVNEKFLEALEKAASADDVVKAMDEITAATKEIAPKMKAIEEKFPEFKNMEEPPAELKPFNDRIMAMMGRMMGAMEKIAPFMEDPKVKEAQARYEEAQNLIR